jgi:hypothetical protein
MYRVLNLRLAPGPLLTALELTIGPRRQAVLGRELHALGAGLREIAGLRIEFSFQRSVPITYPATRIAARAAAASVARPMAAAREG